jgi:predicted DNA-binding protein (UPF0251 family)
MLLLAFLVHAVYAEHRHPNMTQNSPSGYIRTEDQAHLDTEALKLRSMGLTFQKVADNLGISKSTAYERVQRALAAIPAEVVDEYRRLENERLDLLLEVTMEKALSGDKAAMFAVDRALAIMERRGKLNGTDAPQKHEIITLDYIQSEIMRLETQLGETSDDNSAAEIS